MEEKDKKEQAESTERTTKTVTRRLPVKLTDEERLAYAREQAREVIAMAQCELEKKEVVSGFAEKIAGHKKEIARLSQVVDRGIEDRKIDCSMRIDAYLGKVTITRTDTGEIIESRPMTPQEMQRPLDL